MRNRYLLGFVLVLLAAFWLRVDGLNDIPPALHFDEARNLLKAWRIASGYGLPPQLDDIPEPFDIFLRGAFAKVAGTTPFSARLFTIFLNVLSTAAVGAAARALYWERRHRAVIVLLAGLTLAVLPAAVITGRAVYRANWIPLLSLLALAALVWSWRTQKTRHYLLTGVLTGLTMIFYLSGLAMPPVMVGLLIVALLLDRRTWPGWRNLLAAGAAFLVTISPWLYLYFTRPGWIMIRVDAVGKPRSSPLTDPVGFAAHALKSFEPIYNPVTAYLSPGDRLYIPQYDTFTTPWLNPLLLVLFAIGVAVSLWRWRRPMYIVPVLFGVGMAMPGILTDTPQTTVRLMGLFGPLGLMVGLGAGALLARAGRLKPLAWGFVALVCVFSPVYTSRHFWYHFTEQPLWLEPETGYRSMEYVYFTRLRDTLDYVAASDVPVYFPVNYLAHPNAASQMRTGAFPEMHGYMGEPLPDGVVMAPVDAMYGSPYVERSAQYVLALPDAGQMILLPPLPAPAEDTAAMEAHVREAGALVTNDKGWELGYTLPVAGGDNPFHEVQYRAFGDDAEPLAVFNGSLELLDFVAPQTLTPGEWAPVTYYWRLRTPTGDDFCTHTQLWDPTITSRGKQGDGFDCIFRWLHPTAMWTPGEVVPQVRFLEVFEDAPPGGYRYALLMHPQRGKMDIARADAVAQYNEWLWVGRAFIAPPAGWPAPGADAAPVGAVLGDSISLSHAALSPPVGALRAGETLDVTLWWEALAPPPEDYVLFLHLLEESGAALASQDGPPGHYPTGTWYTGARVVSQHTLTVPEDAQGPYTLAVGMYTWPAIERLPVIQEGAPAPDDLIRFGG